MNQIPLCVDLDGTLIKSDVMFELLAAAARRHPWRLWEAPLWLLKGRAYFKQQLAALSELDVSSLPYRADMLIHLHQEHKSGRPIILATAADQSIARRIAEHTGLFTDIIASDGRTNLSGHVKATALVKKFGEKGFDYIGDCHKDLPVWKASRFSLLASPSQRTGRSLRRHVEFHTVFFDPDTLFKDLFAILRPHQWIKNILVIAPLIMAHQLNNSALWRDGFLAWLSFSLTASSLYIINDLFDLSADRLHPIKKNRALAAGRISLPTGAIAAALLLVSGFSIGLALPSSYLTILAFYAAAVMLYSWYLKRIPIVDVVVLASFYVIRLIAGSEATSTPVSFWLLAFSLFFCLSLALVKRTAELVNAKSAHGRGYSVNDVQALAISGIASGYMSVLVLALYINNPATTQLYSNPEWLWLACPVLLYWITRTWLLAQRGAINEDPIIAASKDQASYITSALILLSAFLAL